MRRATPSRFPVSKRAELELSPPLTPAGMAERGSAACWRAPSGVSSGTYAAAACFGWKRTIPTFLTILRATWPPLRSQARRQVPPAGPQWLRGLAPLEPQPLAYDKPLCASLDGFTLHAATRAGALDASGREALLRYVL